MSTTSELAAYERAAEVGQRAGRRRRELHTTPCHVPDGPGVDVWRQVGVGTAGPQCLPPRTRCIELSEEWLRRHHGLVATVDRPGDGRTQLMLAVTLHAPEGDVRYLEVRRDHDRMITHLRRES